MKTEKEKTNGAGGQTLLLPQAACRPMAGFNRSNLDLTPEFQESIRTNGVLVPVLVRRLAKPEPDGTEYEIFAGVRRWKANEMAGHLTLPVRVLEVDDAGARNLRLVENLQREGLTPLDEARQYEETLATTGQTVEQLAAAVGVKRSTIFERRRLLKAQAPVRQALQEGRLEASVAGLLAGIPDPVAQELALGEMLEGVDGEEGPLSFRAAREYLRLNYTISLKGAPFDQESCAYLGAIERGPKAKKLKGAVTSLAGVGSCKFCPRRSGNIEGAEGDPNLCTDPPCYEAKKKQAAILRLHEASANGQDVHHQSDKMFYSGGQLRGDAFVDLDRQCDRIYGKTWRQVLGKEAPPVVLAVDENWDVHELVKRPAAMDALKAAGRLGVKGGSSNGDAWAKEQAKVRARTKLTQAFRAAAAAAVPEILDVMEQGGASFGYWHLLARCAFDVTSIDRHDFIAKRRGLAKTIGESRQAIEKWLKMQDDKADLAIFVFECLVLAPGAHGGRYEEPGFHKPLLEAAALAGMKLTKPKPKAPAAKGKAKGKQ